MFLIVLVLWVALAAGCSADKDPQPRPDLLAVIGGDSLSTAEFSDYVNRLPAGLKQGDSTAAVNRQLLETLIDKKLLQREALKQGLDQDPELLIKLDEFRNSFLLNTYRQQLISAQVQVRPQELEEHYRATNRHRALRFGGALLPNKDAALAFRSQLEAGGDLRQLAAEHSLHEHTAATGGDVGRYLLRDQVAPAIAEGIFHLKVGQLSAPILVERAGKTRYAVFKVLDEAVAPLTASEAAIYQEVGDIKLKKRANALRDSLATAYNLEMDYGAIGWFARLARQSPAEEIKLGAADSARVLCTYQGGQIDAGTYAGAAAAQHVGRTVLSDSLKVFYFLRDNVAPTVMFLAEAHKKGLDRAPALLTAVEGKREELLLGLLRHRQVDQYANASDDEAKAFYEANPNLFKKTEKTEIVEILVEFEHQAKQLREQLDAGADADSLAQLYTLRPGNGRHVVSRQNLAEFKEIYVPLQNLPIGSISGPVATPKGFSVFKILDRSEKLAPFDDKTRKRAVSFVRIRKAKTGFVDYTRQLRQQYQVRIFEDNLAALPAPG